MKTLIAAFNIMTFCMIWYASFLVWGWLPNIAMLLGCVVIVRYKYLQAQALARHLHDNLVHATTELIRMERDRP